MLPMTEGTTFLFFAGLGVAFGLMLCAYARSLVQLKRKRHLLFRRYGGYELAWVLLASSVFVGCVGLIMGVDFVGRTLGDPSSLYALLPILVSVVSGVLSVWAISKAFHPPQ